MNDILAELEPEHSAIVNAIIDVTNALYDPEVFEAISKEELRDALSSGQLGSKQWLIDQLLYQVFCSSDDTSRITNAIVVGGWIGLLAQALNHYLQGTGNDINVFTMDVDVKAFEIANRVTSGRSILGDMYRFDYSDYQLVVNTSAEHIPDVSAWSDLLSKGTVVVVQSNNARHIEEHISCVDSADELAAKLKLSEVVFAGELKFSMYTRFMVIGKK